MGIYGYIFRAFTRVSNGKVFTAHPENTFMRPEYHLQEMRDMRYCINKAVNNGYTQDFKVNDKGLLSLQTEQVYKPSDVRVVDFYRFEGASDPDDNAILYVIETGNGSKGTLVDAYGVYADMQIGRFLKQVEDIHKKSAMA
ncbi:hypothetical protein QEG73_04115 [Chitinophagaceae bacterium 26-R-25]|nr:hypothetical protein [Chitinophagaceae bacterium 26-R-25]